MKWFSEQLHQTPHQQSFADGPEMVLSALPSVKSEGSRSASFACFTLLKSRAFQDLVSKDKATAFAYLSEDLGFNRHPYDSVALDLAEQGPENLKHVSYNIPNMGGSSSLFCCCSSESSTFSILTEWRPSATCNP